MCFRIDHAAQRPTQTTVWKLLAVENGALISPTRVGFLRKRDPWALDLAAYTWRQGEPKQVSPGVVWEHSEVGLYAWLNEEAAVADIPKYAVRNDGDVENWQSTYNIASAPAVLMLAEMEVAPEDWLCTSAGSDLSSPEFGYKDAVTYRRMTLAQITRKFVFDGCSYQEVPVIEPAHKIMES
jgi:hypothetical protein